MLGIRATFKQRLGLAFAVLLGTSLARAQSPAHAPVIHRTFAHDPQAFTQGLVFWQGDLFESTGLYGRSSVRLVDLETGEVLKRLELPSSEFGEGLALVEDRLIQLTWKEGVANVYALDSLQLKATFTYTGEGWGLCFDGQKLVMSDGSSSLFFRNPETFELESSVTVERDGQTVRQLNELECVNGFVYANVWMSEEILKIDARSGQVLATVKARDLLSSAERAGTDVLNGIAFNPDTRRFYLTGKLWPKLFEVEFPAEADPYYSATPSTTDSTSVSSTTGHDKVTESTQTNHGSSLPAPARVATGCRCEVRSSPHGERASWVMMGLGLALAWARHRARVGRCGLGSRRGVVNSRTAGLSA